MIKNNYKRVIVVLLILAMVLGVNGGVLQLSAKPGGGGSTTNTLFTGECGTVTSVNDATVSTSVPGKNKLTIQVYVDGKVKEPSTQFFMYEEDNTGIITILLAEGYSFASARYKNNGGWNDFPFVNQGIDLKNSMTTLQIYLNSTPIQSVELSKTAIENTTIEALGRYYDVQLSALLGEVTPSNVADIAFVLDASGSMPWLVTTPTTSISYNDLNIDANKSDELNKDYNKIRNDYGYKYYVLSANELKPITYVQSGNSYNNTLYGTTSVSEGWYIIETETDGRKSRTSAVTSGIIYVRDPEVNKTKQEILFDSLETFLTNMKSSSPESKVGITTFSNTTTSNIIDFGGTSPVNGTTYANDASAYMFTLANQDISIMMEKLKAQFIITGQTYAYRGLESARKLYTGVPNESVSGRNRYTILFTDGEDSSKTLAINIANDLKTNYDTTIFTIGLFGPSVNTTNATDFLKSVCSTPDDSYFSSISTSDGINDIFSRIFAHIEDDLSNISVKDYIDPRFEVVDTSGNVLTSGATVSGGTLKYDSTLGKYYIEWVNPTLTSVVGGKQFLKTITLKAKDDFIGGNAVPTNTSASGITMNNVSGENEFYAFPMPTINVPFYTNDETGSNTIFYGESLTIDQIKDLMSDTVSDNRISSIIESLLNTGTAQYSYGGSDAIDQFGTLSLTLSDTNEFNSLTNDSKTYNLSVIFTPITQSNRMPIVATANEGRTVTPPTNTEVSVGNIYTMAYTINVVKGELTITRTIDNQFTNNTKPFANQSFVYRIERYSNANSTEPEEIFYEVLSFSANNENINTRTTASALIKGLKKGYYKVTEESDWSYKYNTSNVVDLFIGNKIGNEFFGQEGSADPLKATAAFTGLRKNINWLGDVASMVIK